MKWLSRRAPRAQRAALLACSVVLVEASCRTAPIGPGVTREARFEVWAPAPSVRVGILVDVQRVSLAADSGVVVWDGRAGEVGRVRATVSRATFVAEPSRGGQSDPDWQIQLASLAEGDAAQALARRVQNATGLKAVVRWNASSRTHQVRVGAWATRDAARTALASLARAGFEGGWPIADRMPEAAGVRLLETNEPCSSVTIVPAREGETLTVDGAGYRGLIVVRASTAGALTVVNVVNLEDYLRGVVPNELSPRAYPQIEAQKAQAVAARTYALRNRGQFEAKGFDICATPSCQVYKGKASEQPLSDTAVEQTRGVIVTYGGEPIVAMYTSTCGGHTEDHANVFERPFLPYLKGVPCVTERSAWRVMRTEAAPLTPADGVPPREAGLLLALGVVEQRDLEARGAVTDAEVERWTGRLLTSLARGGCAFPSVENLTRRGAFYAHLVGHLCWEERARRLLAENDVAYLLHLEDRAELIIERERLAAALLMHEQALTPFSDNTLRPNAPITRGEALALLAKIYLHVGAPALLEGELVDLSAGEITFEAEGGAQRRLPVERTARLSRTLDDSGSVTSELLLIPRDRLRLVEREGRVVWLEAQQSRLGAAADRGSRYFRWQVRLTPEEAARGVARHGEVGTLRDLVPRRIGVSGRVVELAVIGTAGEVVLKGLAIRSALGVRENLFVIDRELAPDGRVRRFVISGKGWGHGVGLCQVGASGLAQGGAAFEDILRHYYTGIQIEKRAY